MSDLIDRDVAIDAITQRADKVDSVHSAFWEGLIIARNIVENIPSAEPERKKGKWIEKDVCETKGQIEEWQSAKCSVCGKYHTTPYLYYFDDYAFCPNCGAEMRGENEKA